MYIADNALLWKGGDEIKRNQNRLRSSKEVRTDRGLGRHTFVRNGHKQDKTAKRINIMMRGIISFVIVAVVVIFLVFIFAFLIPFLQAEFSPGDTSEASGSYSYEASDYIRYDAKGLPIYNDEFSLFVINSTYPADADYVPETEKVNGVQVHTNIATALKMLVQDAKDAGLQLVFTDGYISYDEQQHLYDAEVDKLVSEGITKVMATIEAKENVPAAGESDFQTGLCIRLDADPETFTSSKTYEWLNQKMAEYGFVFRYPPGSNKHSGIIESKNSNIIRYVGSSNATAMRSNSNMGLEEYIAYKNSQ